MNTINTIVLLYKSYLAPLLDIALIAFLLYRVYCILVQTQALQLLKGSFSLLVVYSIAFILKLQTLLWILNALTPGIVIGVAIIFQPELRKIFLKIGQSEWGRSRVRSKKNQLEAVLDAAKVLSKKRRGMLVVFLRKNPIREIIETGTKINGELSSALLVTIFGHDTPLHDGAVVVQNGMVIAAGCFLPLSEQQNIEQSFGTRHRAALGTSEQTDAVTLVVSEETGMISLTCDSHLYYDLSEKEVLQYLEYLLGLKLRVNSSLGDLDYEENHLA